MSTVHKTRTLPVKDSRRVAGLFPNFHRSGSIAGMKKQFYGRDALLVRCGQWIYNVTNCPEIYYNNAH